MEQETSGDDRRRGWRMMMLYRDPRRARSSRRTRRDLGPLQCWPAPHRQSVSQSVSACTSLLSSSSLRNPLASSVSPPPFSSLVLTQGGIGFHEPVSDLDDVLHDLPGVCIRLGEDHLQVPSVQDVELRDVIELLQFVYGALHRIFVPEEPPDLPVSSHVATCDFSEHKNLRLAEAGYRTPSPRVAHLKQAAGSGHGTFLVANGVQPDRSISRSARQQ